MTTPQWAVDFWHRAWTDEGRHEAEVPELTYRRGRMHSHSTSGHTYWDGPMKTPRCVVTVGINTRRWAAKHIMLHELSHALCPEKTHHGKLFRTTAWRLYRRYELPIRKIREIEKGYRAGSEAGYLATRFR